MNSLLILTSLIIFLFLIQVIMEIKSASDGYGSGNRNTNNILKKLEDNAISVNERLGLIAKYAEDETMNNINLETNVKLKVVNEIITKVFTEVRNIRKTLSTNNEELIARISEIENKLSPSKEIVEEINLKEKQEKNKEIQFEEIKGKIDKLKEDLNIKNPEEQE